ncbi:MAG: phage tail tape measure protein [Anaerolineales bacterium]|nr:phage tail tape measure protein [Anaerolineales bacterium]
MSSQLGEAFIPIRALLDKLDGDLAGARKKVEGAVGGLGKIGEKIGPAVFKAATVGVLALATAVGTMAVKSVQAAGQFESSMAIMSTAVEPVAVGATDAAGAMDILGDAAIAVGGDATLVGVSASSAAESITGLYKAGLSTNEIFGDMQGYLSGTAELGGALRASVDLAAASELDMVQASDLAAITLATFGGEMETTEERAAFVNDAMNNLVQTADASVASVQGLADALVNVGPTAAALGIGLDDTNVALGILSTRGIQGAEAGTALKSMLVGMMSQTPKTTAALEQLGVTLYDANGAMLPLPKILEQFETGLAGVSEETRNVLVQQIAGSYGMNAMNALLGEGVEGWNSMVEAVGEAATMQETAAARTNTFQGKMEALQGVVETLMIQVGEPFLDALSSLADVMMALAEEHGPAIIARMEQWGAVLEAAVGTVSTLVNWSDQVNAAFAEQSERLVMANTDYATYAEGVIAAGVASGQLTERQAELLAIFQEGGGAMEEMEQATSGRFTPTMLALMDTIGLLTEEERTQVEQVASLDAAYAAAGVTAYTWTAAVEESTTAVELSDQAMAGATTTAGLLGVTVWGVVEAYDAAETAAGLVNDAIGALSATEMDAERMKLALKLATEDLTAAEIEQTLADYQQLEVLAQLNADIAAGTATNEDFYAVVLGGITTMADYNEMMGLTTETISGTEAALIGVTDEMILTNEAIGEKGVGAMTDYRLTLEEIEEPLLTTAERIAGVTGTAEALNSQFNSIPSNIDVNINIHQNGDIPNLPTSGGGHQGQGGTGGAAFATGGIVPGTFAEMVPILAHGSEMILNPMQQARLFGMLDNMANLSLGIDQADVRELAPAGSSYQATTNVYTQQDAMYVLRASRHLDKLGGLGR